ncbi:hypothetical protein [Pseudomonas brassicacearum]|uniref:hypothetical protein n=1 Tax=Pseudomonas brassicacearum TaxID=930166 RepID=UPI0011AEE2B0
MACLQGNELDDNIAGVLRYSMRHPEVNVLLAFSETLRASQVFIKAAQRAKASDKPTMILRAGGSQGRNEPRRFSNRRRGRA